MATLNWTIVDSDGSLFSRGKHDYYAIVIHGIPEEHPKDCIIELYVTDKKMTILDIKYNAGHKKISLLSRQIVMRNLLPVISMKKAIDEMKDTAERRENENPNTAISSYYTSK
jgi:hypothetical protein